MATEESGSGVESAPAAKRQRTEDSIDYSAERQVAIDAVLRACRVCEAVFKSLVSEETHIKKDKSPVTVADFSAQAVVISELMRAFPNDPVVGEEDSKALRADTDAARVLKAKVMQLTNSVLPEPGLTEEQVLGAIDYGMYAGGSTGRHWTLDPIDGTLGFIRGEQYAVCLALIVDGRVVLGVLGCPNLPLAASDPEKRGCLLIGVQGGGAFIRSLDDATETPIAVTANTASEDASFCESVEAAHSAHDDAAKVAELLKVSKAPVRMDSQCKYAAIARGDADIYLRLPTRPGYEERIWDHAAGWLICHEAGGTVTDTQGKDLDFSLGRTLAQNKGVVASNGRLHAQVLAAVGAILYPPPAL